MLVHERIFLSVIAKLDVDDSRIIFHVYLHIIRDH